MLLNLSENDNYNPNLVWINKSHMTQDWIKLPFAIRETSVSWHNRGPIKDSPEDAQYDSAVMHGGLNFSPMMPREASLLDSKYEIFFQFGLIYN